MKRLKLLFILLSTLVVTNSFSQTWQWANKISGTSDIEVRDLTRDSDGNIIVTGYYIGSITASSTNLLPLDQATERDTYVAKYNPDGTLSWIRRMGSVGQEDPFGVTTDEDGNIYVTGGFQETATFDSYVLNTVGTGQDIFLVKLNPSGAVVWARNIAYGTGGDRGYDVVYSKGLLYVSGIVKTTATFGAAGEPGGEVTVTQSVGSYDPFIAKFDTTGDFYWVNKFTHTVAGASLIEGLTIGSSGNIYGGGALLGTLQIDGTTYPSTGSGDMLFVKLNQTTGAATWVRTGGGTLDDQIKSIASDGSNSIYVVGYAQGTGTIDSTSTLQSSSYTAKATDMFIARYTSEGRLMWKRLNGDIGADQAYGVNVNENIILMSGYFSGSVTFNQTTINSGSTTNNDTGFFVYDSDGNPLTAESLSGSGEDRGQGIAYDPDGFTYIGGYFKSPTLTVGTFTLTNASASKDVFVAKYQNPFTAVFTTADNISCFGANDGALTVTPYFGTYPYTYSWTKDSNPFANTDSTAINLAAGTYAVLVTDNNGKTASVSFTIAEPAAILANGITSNVSCYQAGDGAVNLSPTGGTLPYSFFWTTADGFGQAIDAEDQTTLSAGTYDLTITDKNGCTYNQQYTITEPSQINIAGVVSNITAPNNGGVNATISGGTGVYSNFSWKDEALVEVGTGEDLSGLDVEGDYTLTVTDNTGCNVSETFFVQDVRVFSISVTSQTNILCKNEATGSVTIGYINESNPSNVSFLWAPGGETTATISGLIAGTYTVQVTDNVDGITGNGDDKVLTRDVEILEPAINLAGSISQDNVTCYNGSNGLIDLTVTGGSAPFTYQWKKNGANYSTFEDISNLTIGTYEVTITDDNGCTAQTSTVITQPDPIAYTIASTSVSCYGGTDGALAIQGLTGGVPDYTYEWSNGLTSASIQSLRAGSYTATVTDANGCKKSISQTVTQPSRISATLTPTMPQCNGGNDGSITVSASGGTPAYQYSINGTDFFATTTFSGLSSNTYTITVRDDNSCERSFSGIVSQPDAISVSHIANNPTCPESTNGSIGLTVSGGTGTKSYFWTGPGITNNTNKDQTELGVGTYSVRVTDANDCYTDYEVILVAQNASPTPTLSSSDLDNTICLGTEITFTAGGGAQFEFFVEGASAQAKSTDNTLTTSSLSNGDEVYAIVTSAEGCVATTSTIATTVNPLPTVTAPANDALCLGEQVTLTATGTADTYAWDNGINNGVAFAPTATTTYTVTGTITATGCEATDVVTVTVNPLPTVTAPADITICNGEQVTLTATGTADTYTWDNGVTNNVAFAPTATTTYTVTGTITATGCEATDVVTVTVNPLPTVTAPADITICNGEQVTLTATGTADTYTWDNGVTNNIAFAPTATTTYTVTGTITATGCEATDMVTVTVNPLPNGNLFPPGSVSICEGENLTLTASGGSSYEWNTTETTPSIVVNTAGTYTVEIFNLQGCSVTKDVVVNVNPLPTPSITPSGPNTFCQGESVTLTANGGYGYEWNTGATTKSIIVDQTGTYTVTVQSIDGCTADAQVDVTVNPLPTVTAPANITICQGEEVTLTGTGTADTYTWDNSVNNGVAFAPTATTTYTVTGTITATGCEATDVVTVTVNPLPTVTAPDDITICDGEEVTLTATGTADTYTWDNSVNNGVAFTPTATATYTVTGTISATGCQAADVVTVTVNPLPTVNAPADITICQGEEVTLAGTGTADTYTWDNGVTNNVAFTPTATTTYTVTGTIDATGCMTTSQVAVTVNPLPTVTAPNDITVCEGEQVTLSATGTADTYSWDNGVTNGIAFTATSTATYTVTGTIDVTGCTATDQVVVTVNPLPTVSLTSDAAICAGEEITLTATGTADSYSWDNGVTNGIAFAPTATATYTVTATIAATGCEAMGQVTVTVNPLPTVTAPDDFSTCEGTEVTLTATGNADDYSWDNSVTNGVAFTPTTTATYIVTGTINATGCRSTDEVTVTLNTTPTAIISTDREVVCENETVDVTITATTTATTLQWLFNGTPIDGATELTYTATAFGDYTLSASKDGCDCTSNTITIAPTAAPVTSLPTELVTITTADEITLDAGSGFITYLWDNSSNEQTRLVDGTTLEPNTYIYWVEVTNEAGCLTRDTVEVKVDPYQSVTTANGLAVELYPNPTKGVVKIKIDNANGDATISIYSQTGQLINKKQSAVQGKEIADEVDLSNLTKGVYIIQVTTKNQRLTKLVVLE